jgi:hypothetical protein
MWWSYHMLGPTTSFAEIVTFVDTGVKETETMVHVLLPLYFILPLRPEKKQKEHFDEIKCRKKELKQLSGEIDNIVSEKKNLDAFQSKSISAFSTAVTPRLPKAFADKYYPRTANGKLELQRDIATLRLACDSKIPSQSENDKDLLLRY